MYLPGPGHTVGAQKLRLGGPISQFNIYFFLPLSKLFNGEPVCRMGWWGLRWLCELGTLGGSRLVIDSWFLGSLSILWSFVTPGRMGTPGPQDSSFHRLCQLQFILRFLEVYGNGFCRAEQRKKDVVTGLETRHSNLKRTEFSISL